MAEKLIRMLIAQATVWPLAIKLIENLMNYFNAQQTLLDKGKYRLFIVVLNWQL